MADAGFDPLWVPILSHYRRENGELRLDGQRVAAQMRALMPHVRRYLIGGTTGDGWQMTDAMLDQWLDLLSDPAVIGPAQAFIVGAFGPDHEVVTARAQRIEAHFARLPSAGFAGIALCPPVKPGGSQGEILAHLRAVIAATSAPIAVYQLPQVTGCEIAPESFATLAQDCARIFLFKDTSGGDRVAEAALPGYGHVRMLRGAEGDYARHIAPAGRYDGWLLSTANGFAAELRRIAEAASTGDAEAAEADSAGLSALVATLFEEGARHGGNAFADVNRAVDHLRAVGGAWRDAPAPLRGDGSELPRALLAFADAALGETGASGYLA